MTRNLKILLFLVLPLAISLVFGVGIYFPKVGNKQEKANEAFKKGLLLYNAYQYSASKEFFLKALSYNANFHLSRRMLGQAFYFSGEADQAISEWKIILEQGGYDPSLQLHIQNLSSANIKDNLNLVYDSEFPQIVGYRYSRPTFIGSLKNHNIFFLSLGQFKNGNYIEVDPNGTYLRNLRRISSKISMPMGAAENNFKLWITDFKADIIHQLAFKENDWTQVFRQQKPFGSSGSAPGKFHGPAGICYMKKSLYIADSGNNRVQRLSLKGEFLQQFSKINSNQSLRKPFGIACVNNSKIYVSEPSEKRISVFDEYGNYLKSIGEEYLERPRHLNLQRNGILAIADEKKGIFLLNLKTNERKLINGIIKENKSFQAFIRPYSATFDSFDNLIIADYGANKIYRYAPEQKRFSNLEIWVERVSTKSFPIMGITVSVKDMNGNFIEDLNGDNFTLLENGANVGRLGSNYLQKFENTSTGIFIISRDDKMQAYSDSLEWISSFITKEIREKDKIKVLSYNADVRQDTDWTNSTLRIKKALHETNENDFKKNASVGGLKAIQKAIGELLPYSGQKYILLLTSGEINVNDSEFSISHLEDYATTNHTPIFIVSFEHPDITNIKMKRSILKNLAAKTSGKYYTAFGKSIKDINKNILQFKKEKYLLTYQSGLNQDWHNQFVELKIKVQFQKQKGIESFGYFIP